LRTNRTGGRFPEFFDSLGNRFFLWVTAAHTDIPEDVNFCTGDFKAFQSADCEELGSEKGDIGIVTLAGTMVCTAGEHIRLAHRLAGLVV